MKRHTQTVIKIEIFPGLSKKKIKRLLNLAKVFEAIQNVNKSTKRKPRKGK